MTRRGKTKLKKFHANELTRQWSAFRPDPACAVASVEVEGDARRSKPCRELLRALLVDSRDSDISNKMFSVSRNDRVRPRVTENVVPNDHEFRFELFRDFVKREFKDAGECLPSLSTICINTIATDFDIYSNDSGDLETAFAYLTPEVMERLSLLASCHDTITTHNLSLLLGNKHINKLFLGGASIEDERLLKILPGRARNLRCSHYKGLSDNKNVDPKEEEEEGGAPEPCKGASERYKVDIQKDEGAPIEDAAQDKNEKAKKNVEKYPRTEEKLPDDDGRSSQVKYSSYPRAAQLENEQNGTHGSGIFSKIECITIGEYKAGTREEEGDEADEEEADEEWEHAELIIPGAVSLKELYLVECPGVTPMFFRQLAARLPTLRTLCIAKCLDEDSWPEALKPICGLRGLQRLDLRGCEWLTDAALNFICDLIWLERGGFRRTKRVYGDVLTLDVRQNQRLSSKATRQCRETYALCMDLVIDQAPGETSNGGDGDIAGAKLGQISSVDSHTNSFATFRQPRTAPTVD